MPLTRRLPGPRTVLHILLTFVVGWWSLILALPGNTFATTTAMSAFNRVATEEQWSGILAFVSLCGVAGIRWRRFRLASINILAFAHGMISMTILFSNPIATGAGTYGALMVCAWYLLVTGDD